MEDDEEKADEASITFEHIDTQSKKINEILKPNGTFDLLGGNITDPNMIEMKKSLEGYKQEFYSNIYNENEIEFRTFKEPFFKNLQILLYQVILIRDEKLKDKKLKLIYNWYKGRMDFFNSLKEITTVTSKVGLKIPKNLEKNIKNEMYMAMNYPTAFEDKHRTLPDCVLKTTLKELERNMIDRDKYINKELNLINFIEKKLQDYESLIKSSKDMSEHGSTKYSDTKSVRSVHDVPNLSNFMDEDHDKFKKEDNPSTYDAKRSFKSTYAYMNPKVDYSNLELENKIREQKELDLAEKRYQFETMKYLLAYGENKAKATSLSIERLEKKLMIPNLNPDEHEAKKIRNERIEREENEKRMKEKEIKKSGLIIDRKRQSNISDSSAEEIKKHAKDRNITSAEKIKYDIRNMNHNQAKSFQIGNHNHDVHDTDNQNQVNNETANEINKANYSNVKNISTIAADYNKDVNTKFDIVNEKSEFYRQDNVYYKVDEAPSDYISITKRDKVFNARQLYSDHLGLKKNETLNENPSLINEDKNYYKHNVLSVYDNKNISRLNNKLFSIQEQKTLNRNKSVEIKKNIFLKKSNVTGVTDLLEQRKTYSRFLKTKENYKIINGLERENMKIQASKLENLYLPNIEAKDSYNRYYLPQNSGIGLNDSMTNK